MEKARQWVQAISGKLLKTGFYSIFFASAASKVLSFLGGIVVVRVLSKSDYGQYTYIMNCYSILLLLNDLGCSQAAFQMCNENYNDHYMFSGYYIYALKKGLLFCSITAGLLLLSPLFYPFRDPEAAHLTQMMCLMPFFNVISSFIQMNLRARMKNSMFARINIFSTVITYIIILPMAYFIGVRGAVLSHYVIIILVDIYGLWLSRHLLDFSLDKNILKRKEKSQLLKLAVASQLNNVIDQGMMLLDVFLIGLFIYNTDTLSSYKVATTIPTGLLFIPQAVMTYIGPYFARKNKDIVWVRKNYIRMLFFSAIGNLAITCGLVFLSPWLIPLVFGKQYADAVACFVYLMIGYFFAATFRITSANVIYTQHKIKVNIIITVLASSANCVLDVILILKIGSIGAAIATMTVHIINSILSVGYMYLHFRRSKQ